MLKIIKKAKVVGILLLTVFILISAYYLCFRRVNWFSFTIPFDDKSDNIVNVGKIVLDAPAGKYGFVKADKGHFFYDNGKRVRFWGVNLSMAANFPSHKNAEKIASHIAKYGFNIVRLHNFDNYAPDGIFVKGSGNTLTFDKTQLDKLDYLVYQLKIRGIYVDMNLYVNRVFTKMDGVAFADELSDNVKAATMFDPHIIDLQKDYTRKLLTHYNPYTKTCYNNEPAVAMVEIINENSIFEAWKDGNLTSENTDSLTLPEYYRNELDSKWNIWLKEKYKDMQKLKESWQSKAKIGNNLIRNSKFQKGLGIDWTQEVHDVAAAKFSIDTDEKDNNQNSLRVDIYKSSNVETSVQLQQNGISLKKGKKYLLTFRVKSDVERSISVEYGKDMANWDNYGLYSDINVKTKWTNESIVFSPNQDTTATNSRLSFEIGNLPGTMWFKDIELTEVDYSSEDELKQGKSLTGDESLENSNILRTAWKDRFSDSEQRVNDNTEFYYTIEKNYYDNMLAYIHDKIGIKAPISTSNTYYGNVDLMAQAAGDFINTHNYWDDLSFPKEIWDRNNFTQNNNSLIRQDINSDSKDAAETFLGTISLSAIKGKPLVLSEWNSTFPNDYQYELPAIITSNALLQDWDGLFLYAYSHNENNDKWDIYYIFNWFDIDNNPGIMAQVPACALAFIRGDFKPSINSISLSYNKKDVLDDYIKNDEKLIFCKGIKMPLGAIYTYKIRKADFNAPKTVSVSDCLSINEIKKLSMEKTHKSDNGEIEWNGDEAGHEFVIFNTNSFQGIDGFVAGEHIVTKNVDFKLDTSCASLLVSMDGKSIGSSKKMLMSFVGRIKNTDQKKDKGTNGLENWGRAPVLMEKVRGEIKITNKAVNFCNIYLLDSKGNRIKKVYEYKKGKDIVIKLCGDSTPWYEIDCG